eukprot:COSAG02_NODE_1096_length_14601_cov_185.142946_1_plen_194_part_00
MDDCRTYAAISAAAMRGLVGTSSGRGTTDFACSGKVSAYRAIHPCTATACFIHRTRHTARSDSFGGGGTRGRTTAGGWSAAGRLQPPASRQQSQPMEILPPTSKRENSPPRCKRTCQTRRRQFRTKPHLARRLPGSLAPNLAEQRSAPNFATPRYASWATSSCSRGRLNYCGSYPTAAPSTRPPACTLRTECI